ncbi:choice-of-anchor D domain-containing protein, partial [Verrucomicrobiota bacterium]
YGRPYAGWNVDDVEVLGDIVSGPEMAVAWTNGQELYDGDYNVLEFKGTDLGDIPLGVAAVSRVYTITNKGIAALNLTGSPIVQLAGHTGNFTVKSQPSTTALAADESTTFELEFDPTTAGIRSATVSIANNDADENSYDFGLQARVIDIPSVNSGSATNIKPFRAELEGILTDGVEADVYVFWGKTDGGTDPAQWSNTGLLTQVDEGAFSYPIDTLNADTEYFYTFYVENIAGNAWGTSGSFTTLTTELLHFKTCRGSAVIPNGSTTVTLVNGVDYLLTPASTISNAFIRLVNTELSGGGSTNGTDASSSRQHDAWIDNPENLLTSVDVKRFHSGSSCALTWEVIEYIGDPGGLNEMIVRGQGSFSVPSSTSIVTGPELSDISDTNRVVVFITGQAANDSNYVRCKGVYTAELDSSRRPVFRRNSAGRSGSLSYSVVEFTGIKWSDVQRVEHTVANAPNIEVELITAVETNKAFMHVQFRGSSSDRAGGTVWFSATNEVSFKQPWAQQGQVMIAWIVESLETDPAAAMKVQHIKRPFPAGTSLEETESITTLAAVDNSSVMGEYGTLTKLNMILTGASELTIIRNRAFNLSYTCSVVEWPMAAPDSGNEMDLFGNGVEIADGDDTPSISDDTDFGNAVFGLGGLSHIFTVTNSGTNVLNLVGIPTVRLTGHTNDFTVTVQPSATVGVGASTTFTVKFDPIAAGERSAIVSILNDDFDENQYAFTVQGFGVVPEMAMSGDGLEIVDGDNVPDVGDGTDYGDLALGQSSDQIFVINNLGFLELQLTGTPKVLLTGHTNDFTVISQPPAQVDVLSTEIFTVRFEPLDAGVKTVEVSIANDDPDENPYTFRVQGRGLDVPVVTSSAATDIGGFLAQLHGTLSDGMEADVYVYWGTTDGGTDPAQWSNTGLLSQVNEGAFSYPVEGLGMDTTYYYNFCATNIAGGAWAASDSFTTTLMDFKVQRGSFTMPVDTLTVTLTNGADYTLEAGSNRSNSFIRIVNTRLTGGGHDSGGGDQHIARWSCSITNPANLADSVTFARNTASSYASMIA